MSTQVLHVIARMNVGGTARYVGELVEKIPNSKLGTGYVQGSEIEDPCVEKLNVLRVPHLGRKISPLNDFRAWLELRKIIKEIKPAIVHTHTFKAGLVGRLIGGGHERVHTFHGHLFEDQSFSSVEKYFITIVEKFLARKTDLLVSVGKKVGAELRAQGVGPEKTWISIAPGVTPLPIVQKKYAREKLSLKTDGILFGWMARMAEVKNPFLFLEIARELPQINFAMAGGGSLLQEIKNSAPKNVTILGWTDASIFWSAVDCAISTSDNEGMPIALIEAQLSGVPVIATNVGSNSEVIQDSVTGIITSKNLHDLAQSIIKISHNKKLVEAMARAAAKHAEQEFTIEKMIKHHELTYRSLLRS